MMENRKRQLRDSWNIKIYGFYILNGFKNIIKNPKLIILSVVYWMVVRMFHIVLEINMINATGLRKYSSDGMIIILYSFGLIVYSVFLFFVGKPKGANRMISNFIRIGLVNHAGETPLLVSRNMKSDSDVFVLKFYNCGIPVSLWNDCKEDI